MKKEIINQGETNFVHNVSVCTTPIRRFIVAMNTVSGSINIWKLNTLELPLWFALLIYLFIRFVQYIV